MNQPSILPFNLTKKEMKEVQIVYSSHSAKSGVGKDEIRISGKGNVRLLEEKVINDSDPRIFEAAIKMLIILQLLDLMEDEDFFSLEDLYSHESGAPIGIRIIELILPDRNKKVILDQPATCLAFERIAGAIKMAVSMAAPEVLQQRFFRRF